MPSQQCKEVGIRMIVAGKTYQIQCYILTVGFTSSHAWLTMARFWKQCESYLSLKIQHVMCFSRDYCKLVGAFTRLKVLLVECVLGHTCLVWNYCTNFLIFRPQWMDFSRSLANLCFSYSCFRLLYAIISKKVRSSFFELFKNKAILWLWYVPIYFQTFNFFIFYYILLKL